MIKYVSESTFNNSMLNIISFLPAEDLEDIEPGTFSNLPEAHYFLAESSKLKIIRKGVFTNTNFYSIALMKNQIQTIENGAFSGMKNLLCINLDENQLTSFDGSLVIGDSITIRVIELPLNNIKEIKPNMFNTLTALKYLNLSQNSIEEIESHSFNNMTKLKTLDLSHNQLEKINPNIFGENRNLTHLYLHSNKLDFISEDVFKKLFNLEVTTLTNNPLQCACKKKLISWFHENKIIDTCEDLHEIKIECQGNECFENNEDKRIKLRKDGLGNCYPLDWFTMEWDGIELYYPVFQQGVNVTREDSK